MTGDVNMHNKSLLNECRYMASVHPLSRPLSSGRALAVILVI